MARETNKRIQKENLILCEGRDEEEFLIKYLNSAELSSAEYFANDFQVMDFGGNQNLSNYLNLIKNMDGFDKVKSILIIRDAERNAEVARQEIINALRNAGLPFPESPHSWVGNSIKIGFLLFPACSDKLIDGTLEDLCISILSEEEGDAILGEIQGFMNHLTAECCRSFPHEFKTKLHTYFSITDRYVSLKIGEAAAAGAFDWGNRELAPLHDFLSELF